VQVFVTAIFILPRDDRDDIGTPNAAIITPIQQLCTVVHTIIDNRFAAKHFFITL
jgi:hypothetical protein